MMITLFGITMEVRDLQYWNALSPMLVTGFPKWVEGISILIGSMLD